MRKRRELGTHGSRRGTGKTTNIIKDLIRSAQDKPGSKSLFLIPCEAFKGYVVRLFAHLLGDEAIRFVKARSCIEMDNGSVIQITTADRPERFRGISFNQVKLDHATTIGGRIDDWDGLLFNRRT